MSCVDCDGLTARRQRQLPPCPPVEKSGFNEPLIESVMSSVCLCWPSCVAGASAQVRVRLLLASVNGFRALERDVSRLSGVNASDG